MVQGILARLRPDRIRRNGVAAVVLENALPDDHDEALAIAWPELIAERRRVVGRWP